MTALQRLQDAITKLEQLREHATGDAWSVEDRIESSAITVPVMEDGEVAWVADAAEFLTADTARLIVTVHRTIDAQLSILAYGATLAGPIPECILALADSILDGEQ